jgi:heterodisulfide reductase subunit C
MTKEVENVSEADIKKCVQCGYCCKQGPCEHGRAHNFHSPFLNHPKACIYLRHDDDNLSTFRCVIWNAIKEREKNARFPMCGSGCSSTLFNEHRHRVLQEIREMAVVRLLPRQKVMWITTKDNETCPKCRALHGRVLNITKPPLHVGCRCYLGVCK